MNKNSNIVGMDYPTLLGGVNSWKPNLCNPNKELYKELMYSYYSLDKLLMRLHKHRETETREVLPYTTEVKGIAVELRKLVINEDLIGNLIVDKPDVHPFKRIPLDCAFVEFDKKYSLPFPNNSSFVLYNLVGYNFLDGVLNQGIYDKENKKHIKWDKWKKQEILQLVVGEKQYKYSLEDLLKFVINKETVHIDNCQNKKESDQLLFIFSNFLKLSYPKWITLCTGAYLYNMLTCSMLYHTEEWKPIVGNYWDPNCNIKYILTKESTANIGRLNWKEGIVPTEINTDFKRDFGLIIKPGRDTVNYN